MTAETSNAQGEWPERYACNGPEGTFWTDDAALANKLIGAAFDRDEWTVTDTQNPTGAAPSSTAKPDARGVVDEGSRIVTSQLLHWGGIPVYVTGTVTTSPGNWSLIDATLASQHQEPKS